MTTTRPEHLGPSIPVTDPLMGHSDPGRWWTSANTAEAMQGILLPFDWTFQAHGIELGGRRSWFDLGLLEEHEVYLPTDPNESFMGTFYGRVGINVSFAAGLFDRMPGGSGADVEMALLGFHRADTTWTGTDEARVPHVIEGMSRLRAEQGRRLDDAEKDFDEWWRDHLDGLATGRTEPWKTIGEAAAQFDRGMHLHLRTRFTQMMAQAALAAALAEVGMAGSWALLISAVDTAEAVVADDLWALAKGGLTVEDFLAAHGYHGPNEGAVSSLAWREDPAPVLHATDALRHQPDHDSLKNRRQRTLVERATEERRFLAASSSPDEHLELLNFGRRCVTQTEQGKRLTLLAVDVARAATRLVGQEGVSSGHLHRAEDLYLFTVDEVLAGYPANADEIITFRKGRRAEYGGYDVPLTWEGMPTPVVLAELPDQLSSGTLRGVGVGNGVYEGRARIVRDPKTDRIESGEVLVCPATDPSWLTVFAVAAAVVVEIGGPTSHGAIVAREFGLPCVMSVSNATRILSDGDLVRVNGDDGEVIILATSLTAS